jgi:two-component system sensor histidine kinase ResE
MEEKSRIGAELAKLGFLESVFDAMREAVLFVDAGGTVRLASAKIADFFGFDPEQMVGRPFRDLEEKWSKSFAEFSSFHEVLAHPLEDREADFMRDVEISQPEHRFLEVNSSPVLKTGAFVGRLWIMRDITHERELTELKIQYGGLRGADEIKSKFLTIASHQLRTPLNSMRWNLELVIADDAAIPKASRDLMREVYQSVISSLAIVDDMLLAVDIEQRTLALDKTSVDIADVVAKVVRDADLSATLRKQTISFVPSRDLPPLFIDAVKIEKVMSRLVDNAIKYTPEGGKIGIEIVSGKDDISVSVSDDGVGIPSNERASLFGRFYRSRKALDMNPNASGLGLFIAKFIVEAHDGTISYRARQGKGSVFTVRLPRRAAARR